MIGRLGRVQEMHEFFVGLVFIAIVMAPCVVALTTRLDDAEIK